MRVNNLKEYSFNYICDQIYKKPSYQVAVTLILYSEKYHFEILKQL